MNKYILLITLSIFILIGMASSQNYYELNSGFDYKGICINNNTICSDSTECNLTILYPNQSYLINFQPMTNLGNGDFNYTLEPNMLNELGSYTTKITCIDGTFKNTEINNFEVTSNGSSPASGGVIVLFVILFIILAGLTCYLALYTIGHLMSLDFDLIDLAFDWGLYFTILTLYWLERLYLGNAGMETYFLWFISLGGVLLVLIPIISFVLSITIGSLSKKRIQAMTPPSRIRFRRGI